MSRYSLALLVLMGTTIAACYEWRPVDLHSVESLRQVQGRYVRVEGTSDPIVLRERRIDGTVLLAEPSGDADEVARVDLTRVRSLSVRRNRRGTLAVAIGAPVAAVVTITAIAVAVSILSQPHFVMETPIATP